MANLINKQAIEELIVDVLEKDMNECLDRTTDEVIAKLHDKVKANVAARMIALVQSDYNLMYARDELVIRVSIKTGG